MFCAARALMVSQRPVFGSRNRTGIGDEIGKNVFSVPQFPFGSRNAQTRMDKGFQEYFSSFPTPTKAPHSRLLKPGSPGQVCQRMH